MHEQRITICSWHRHDENITFLSELQMGNSGFYFAIHPGYKFPPCQKCAAARLSASEGSLWRWLVIHAAMSRQYLGASKSRSSKLTLAKWRAFNFGIACSIRERSVTVTGISRAEGFPCLIMTIFSPSATRSSSVDKCVLASKAPTVIKKTPFWSI